MNNNWQEDVGDINLAFWIILAILGVCALAFG